MKQRKDFPASDLSARLSYLDFPCILFSLLMAGYGLVLIYSATHASGGGRYIPVQLFACLLGIVGMLVFSVLDYESILKRFWIPLFFVALVLLVSPLFIGQGEGTNQSWIRIGGIGFQPSEFVKLIFIGTFSAHLDRVRKKITSPLSVLGLGVHFAVIFAFMLLQGDLGSALVFFFIFLLMTFAAGVQLRYYLLSALALAGVSPLLWSRLSYYQKQRILVGFSPESDPQGFGYQVLRAKEAIANGGLHGMGFLGGALSQNTAASALPKRHTDMIFAVMAEEFGFIGVVVYLALFVLLIFRILWISRKARGYMGSYLCIGVAAVFLFQGLENIGMCLGLLPVIGLTLPFISYGGSSCLTLFWLIGAVESVYVHRVKYYFERDEVV